MVPQTNLNFKEDKLSFSELYRLMQFKGRDYEMAHRWAPLKIIPKAIQQIELTDEKAKSFEKVEDFNNFLIQKVIEKTMDFLAQLDIEKIESDKMSLPKYEINPQLIDQKGDVFIDYDLIKEEYKLNNIEHIVWMRFAKNKNNQDYLGVVAAGKDINFSDNTNSSGLIKNSKIGLEWDKSFVLVFPLPGITDGMRKDIEVGIGNYLAIDVEEYKKTGKMIKEDIGIVDFYSHRYQR